jgi:hypothetical protein
MHTLMDVERNNVCSILEVKSEDGHRIKSVHKKIITSRNFGNELHKEGKITAYIKIYYAMHKRYARFQASAAT